MDRDCGVLLPVFSLPSPYGIGTLGKAAYAFIDFLVKAGQSWWQLLPVGHTGCGNSPYQCFSAFAGNPYLIDLELLCEEGLLSLEEIDLHDWGSDPERVDYAALYRSRWAVLNVAAERVWMKDAGKIEAFLQANAAWLTDYALFMALKQTFGMKPWCEWPDEAICLRRPDAMAYYRSILDQDIRRFTAIQYFFFCQWQALHDYARQKGIGLIGDLPIYVALDCADIWADPDGFRLDAKHWPVEVAGVPPDEFSIEGQLWGNPIYDWDAMRKDGYRWWMRRVKMASQMFDALRLDHFRGFFSYWAVPAGEMTAKKGCWRQGPGMTLLKQMKAQFAQTVFIAEDLGSLTPEVDALRRESGFCGMKVLQFAFDGDGRNPYLPHHYPPSCVCYPGTHDNPPLMAWKAEASPDQIVRAEQYFALNDREGFAWGMLRGGLCSTAALFIAQMQDYLELGAVARINTPGTVEGNWQWRLRSDALTPELA